MPIQATDIKRFSRLFWAIWTLSAVLSLSLFGLIVFVAIHFLAKVW